MRPALFLTLLSAARELLTNWNFSNGTLGWTAQSNTTLSESGGLMSVLNVGSNTAVSTQIAATVPNGVYEVVASLISFTGSNPTVRVGVSSGTGSLLTSDSLSAGVYRGSFVATTATSYVRLVNGTITPLAGQGAVWDYVSCKRIG
jgi:hypothetical protein